MERGGQDPDRDDVRRVLAGDPDAFAGIVRRWQGPLVNLAYRFCRNRAQAEEMAQEAFLRVFRFLSQWKDDAKFSTWLFAVATNVYRSQMRRIRPPEVPLEEDREIPAPGNPGAEIEADDLAEVVRRAVAALPPKYRDALILFYFQNMDVRETARNLGVPEGTVKARLHRGRAMLEQRIERLASFRPQAEAS
jgi:RNA polymerase sigma-70 factor (ECF subfamily)